MPPGHGRIVLAFIGAVAKIAPTVDHLLRRTAADSQLQPAASNHIRGPGVFRHVMRILIAHVDDRGADLDLSRFSADRRKQWKR